ncbi:MAG: site-specific integrase [Pseudomonadota bacterium]
MRKLCGYYYSRIFIPKDLYHFFPKTEYQFSLKTKDHQAALTQHQSIKAEAERLFLLIRFNLITPEYVPKAISESSVFRTRPSRVSALVKAPVASNHYPAFVVEKMASGEWKEKTRQETQTCMNLFLDIIGDKPVTAYTHAEMLYFRECLLKLPPAFQKNPQLRSLTIKEILARQWDKTLSLARVNRILNGILSFFTWCVKHHYIEKSPCQGIRFSKGNLQKAEKPRSPFTIEELKVLIRQPEFHDHELIERHPGRFWVPLIALFSGLRLNEICQLYVKDIKVIEGILAFDISADESDKSLKTVSSRRVIPVHPHLIERGFEHYVQTMLSSGQQRLFPMFRKGIAGYSHSIQGWFTEVKQRLGMKKCFHELRHSFAFYLKQAGVDEVSISELLGHSNTSMTARYSHHLTIQRKLEIISKLQFPGCVRLARRDLGPATVASLDFGKS